VGGKLVDKAAGDGFHRRTIDAEPVPRDRVYRLWVPVAPIWRGTNEMGFLRTVFEYPGHFDWKAISTERRSLKVQECAQDRSSFE
jgi:hypothetical protein